MDEKRLREISNENIELMLKKNQAYSGNSGDNITNTGINGIAVRLMDKITRLLNLTRNPGDINFESVEDTLNDISNYGLIGRLLSEGSWQEVPRMVYLAGPVDQVLPSGDTDWRSEISIILGDHGVLCYTPNTPYNVVMNGMRSAEQVCNICRYAISQSDVVLARYVEDIKAIGTVREIEYAKSIGKRVILITDEKTATVSRFVYDLEIARDLNEALSMIVKSR